MSWILTSIYDIVYNLCVSLQRACKHKTHTLCPNWITHLYMSLWIHLTIFGEFLSHVLVIRVQFPLATTVYSRYHKDSQIRPYQKSESFKALCRGLKREFPRLWFTYKAIWPLMNLRLRFTLRPYGLFWLESQGHSSWFQAIRPYGLFHGS